jgi:HEAT repeat protein
MASHKPNLAGNKLPENVEDALTALQTFDNGGQRPALLPLDEAAVRASSDPVMCRALETRLLELLSRRTSSVAVQYICGKLILIGGAASATPLASLLGDPKASSDARSALEAIPDPAAGRAILKAIPALSPQQKAGAMLSLGVQRDGFAVGHLAAELHSPDACVRKAAAAALGRIGDSNAAAKLERFYSRSKLPPGRETADAILTCAELLETTSPKQAARLRGLLATHEAGLSQSAIHPLKSKVAGAC